MTTPPTKGTPMAKATELTYDPKKVRTVPIEHVRPNPWNPKVHKDDGKDFQKVVASLRENGLRQPVVVRTAEPTEEYPDAVLEVIDGEQRWRAALALGYTRVVVYDEGEVPDERAKALTIWYQQQVPFDEVLEAHLAAALAELDVPMPYSEEELAHLQKLARFDFDQLTPDDGDGEDADETRTLHIKFTVRQFEVITSALAAAEEDGSPTDARTITTWAEEFLATRGGAPQ